MSKMGKWLAPVGDEARGMPGQRQRKVAQLDKSVKRAVRKMWLDGDLWASQGHLAGLLGEMLQEATGAAEPVPLEGWASAAAACVEWTDGTNRGPASRPGRFQQALLAIRTVASRKANIIQHWIRSVKMCPRARATYHSDMLLSNVDDDDVEHHVNRLNHELSRTNSHGTKKLAANRATWYQVDAVPAEPGTLADFLRVHPRHGPTPSDYLLEAIVEERPSLANGETLFKCRWEGCSCEQDTWEPLSSIGAEHPEMVRWRTKIAKRPAENESEDQPSAKLGKTKTPVAEEPPQEASKNTPAHKPTKAAARGTAKARKDAAAAGKTTKKPTSAGQTKDAAAPATKRASPVVTAPPQARAAIFRAPNGHPDPSKRDISVLKEGTIIWVEYFGDEGSDDMKWFGAKILLVSPSGPVPTAKVVRVQFEDGQKETLNLQGLHDADKLEQMDGCRYQQFNWSS